jgi:phosphomannomutase
LAERDGLSVQDRLDAIEATYGKHVIADASVRMDPVEGAAAVALLRSQPPVQVADRVVTDFEWFDEATLLRLHLGDELRLQIRPSGTEPKVKLYGEGLSIDPAPYLDALAAMLSAS